MTAGLFHGRPGWGWTATPAADSPAFISRRVLPRLRALGASDQEIHQLMVENPRRFFEGN